MSVTTTTGKPIGDYEDYHTEDGQPIADVSYFEQDAVIPLSGKYAQSDARKTTKSVKLSDIIGGSTISVLETGGNYEPVSKISVGSGLDVDVESGEAYINIYCDEETISNDGHADLKVLYDDDTIVVNDNGLEVKNPVPTPRPNHADYGKVLSVDGADEIVWGPEPISKLIPSTGLTGGGSGGRIGIGLDTTGANNGDVLTKSADGVTWSAPAPGLPDTTGHSQGDVLTIGVSGPSWTAPVHIPVIGTINISPAPSYNYIILQNFLDGETIGTPIPGDGEDYSDFYNTYPADKEAVGWDGCWSDTNLVSTTAGSQLLYSEAGFDFSKYGLTEGQIPFGYTSAASYSGGAYANITLPTEFTYETWFNSPTNYLDGSFTTFYDDDWTGLRIWLSGTSISILFDGADNDTIFSESLSLSAGQWHHFALSCDGTNMYVLMDGHLLGTIVIANVTGLAEFLASTMREIDNIRTDNDRGPGCVWLAQLALCDSCKWTSDYELPKEAY